MVTGRATDGIVRSDDSGTVTVSLEPIMTELRTNLRDRGFTVVDRLPTFDPQFEILQSDERSEEHTSELQSLMRISYAVFCLKKKNNQSEYDTSKQQDIN